MSRLRLVGVSLITVGITLIAAVLLIPSPDDEAFMHALRQKDAPGDWTSGGAMYSAGKSYRLEFQQKHTMDPDDTSVMAATLHATDGSGRVQTYRRTRYTDQSGYTAEVVEETPTRTIKKGRGRSGKEPYSEVVLVDKRPLLARPSARTACTVAAVAMLLCGLALLPARLVRRLVSLGRQSSAQRTV